MCIFKPEAHSRDWTRFSPVSMPLCNAIRAYITYKYHNRTLIFIEYIGYCSIDPHIEIQLCKTKCRSIYPPKSGPAYGLLHRKQNDKTLLRNSVCKTVPAVGSRALLHDCSAVFLLTQKFTRALCNQNFAIGMGQISILFTVCPGSSDPFYIVCYYIKWVTTSWTYCMSGPVLI